MALLFFHPDFTVGPGITPESAFRLAGFTAGKESHLTLKNVYSIVVMRVTLYPAGSAVKAFCPAFLKLYKEGTVSLQFHSLLLRQPLYVELLCVRAITLARPFPFLFGD